MTIGSHDVTGVGTVLVDSAGMTLYSPVQESSGSIVCTGPCAKVWLPLTVKGSAAAKGGSGVTATFATVSRPDGTTQVTANGAPLYTFTGDAAPGDASGEGATDAFGGKSFTWHAVSSSGTVPSTQPSSTSSGGYGGYGGYH
jgi:predicted lipoprotein with Yx(FWY)xxD motif